LTKEWEQRERLNLFKESTLLLIQTLISLRDFCNLRNTLKPAKKLGEMRSMKKTSRWKKIAKVKKKLKRVIINYLNMIISS